LLNDGVLRRVNFLFLMRYPLCFLALLLAFTSANAQNSLAVTQANSLTVAQAAPDTAAAIHRLFASRRKTCTYVMGGTALAVGAGSLVALNQPNQGTGGGSGFSAGVDGRPIIATFIGVLGVPVLGAELLFLGGWGHRNEQRAIAAFEKHQLPNNLKRKLTPAYFRP
jgi:hypothetical protein